MTNELKTLTKDTEITFITQEAEKVTETFENTWRRANEAKHSARFILDRIKDELAEEYYKPLEADFYGLIELVDIVAAELDIKTWHDEEDE